MDWRDGQARRAWLDGLDAKVGNALAYYLGPALAPKINALAEGAAMLSPGADFMDAREYGGEAMNALAGGDWMDAARGMGMTGAAMLGMALPGKASQVDDAVEGIRAYHGSPHDFDRFDMSKIGTGEGAQAQGVGAYLTNSESYARQHADMTMRLAEARRHGIRPRDLEAAWLALQDAEGSTKKAKTILRRDWGVTVPSGVWGDLARSEPGKVYEINLRADPDAMLNRNASYEEQPQAVRDVYSRVAANFQTEPRSGADVYSRLALREDGMTSEALASERLLLGGVSAAKYTGHGAENYVVFDDSLIEILRKYGLLGAVGLGGAVGVNALAQPPEGEL
jgi:hypothetical protein